MLRMDDADHTLHEAGVPLRDIAVLVDVLGQVVKARDTFHHHQLPVPHPQAYLVGFMELPV